MSKGTTKDRCTKEIVLKLDCELFADLNTFILYNNKLNIKTAIEKAIRLFIEGKDKK